jgi:hypothetical protein
MELFWCKQNTQYLFVEQEVIDIQSNDGTNTNPN